MRSSKERNMSTKFYRVATGLVFCAAFALGGSGWAVAEPACASDDEAVCKAEKDERMAMYIKGRNAYENARTAGDFTEAYSIARKLASDGDKNGERLFKMVNMQLGWGAHKDLVQAYVWLSEGVADGVDYVPLWRDKLAEKMSPEQLADAKKKAGN
jgi:hypothetical protein